MPLLAELFQQVCYSWTGSGSKVGRKWWLLFHPFCHFLFLTNYFGIFSGEPHQRKQQIFLVEFLKLYEFHWWKGMSRYIYIPHLYSWNLNHLALYPGHILHNILFLSWISILYPALNQILLRIAWPTQKFFFFDFWILERKDLKNRCIKAIFYKKIFLSNISNASHLCRIHF